MQKSTFHATSPNTFQAVVAMLVTGSTTRVTDPNNAQLVLREGRQNPITDADASLQIGAIKLATDELAIFRKIDITDPKKLLQLKQAIWNGELTETERVLVAKAYDGIIHSAGPNRHGLENVTGERYRASITELLASHPDREISHFANYPQVTERLGELRAAMKFYLEGVRNEIAPYLN